jgi:hypothetical protein
MVTLQSDKETPAMNIVEGLPYVQAEEAAIRKRFKANTGSMYRSFIAVIF